MKHLSDKIQISEQQARDMLRIIDDGLVNDRRILEWKQAGYIKKSALEEAREWVKHELREFKNTLWSQAIEMCSQHYETAIKEILDENRCY